MKNLSKNFRIMVIPNVGNGLNGMQYPLEAFGIPTTADHSFRIYVRSGILYLSDNSRVTNVTFKAMFDKVIERTCFMGTTIEALVTFPESIAKEDVMFRLLNTTLPMPNGFTASIEMQDMIYENVPNIPFNTRVQGLNEVFHNQFLGKNVTSVNPNTIKCEKELQSFIQAMAAKGQTVKVMNPNSGYNYETPQTPQECAGYEIRNKFFI